MQIQIISKKAILTSEAGRLPTGMTVDVTPQLAAFLIERGEAVAVETKATVEQEVKRGRKKAE